MTVLYGLLTVFLLTGSGLILLIRKALRDGPYGGWGYSWYGTTPLKRVNCKDCEGTGIQVLIEGQWSIIPVEWRTWLTGDMVTTNPPTANYRSCPSCLGKSFHLLPETAGQPGRYHSGASNGKLW